MKKRRAVHSLGLLQVANIGFANCFSTIEGFLLRVRHQSQVKDKLTMGSAGFESDFKATWNMAMVPAADRCFFK
jgi:hypothetical protein